jgi:hypothetical protein
MLFMPALLRRFDEPANVVMLDAAMEFSQADVGASARGKISWRSCLPLSLTVARAISIHEHHHIPPRNEGELGRQALGLQDAEAEFSSSAISHSDSAAWWVVERSASLLLTLITAGLAPLTLTGFVPRSTLLVPFLCSAPPESNFFLRIVYPPSSGFSQDRGRRSRVRQYGQISFILGGGLLAVLGAWRGHHRTLALLLEIPPVRSGSNAFVLQVGLTRRDGLSRQADGSMASLRKGAKKRIEK